MKSCFLFGHSDCPQDVLLQIIAAVDRQYTQRGIRKFYVGNRGNFDRLATTALRQFKKQHPEVELYLLLAYHPGERKELLPEDFDGSFYPPIENVPRPYRIIRANQYMVDTVDAVICYVNHIGNTRELLNRIYRRKKIVGELIDNIAIKN